MLTKRVKIDEILINEENPRNEPQNNEAEAVKELLKKEAAFFNLMTSIAKDGIDESERVILAQINGLKNYIAMDGNRRITCLKLLNSSSFLPEDLNNRERFEKKIGKIIEKFNYKEIKFLDAVIYDLETEEEKMKETIRRKHTGENKGVGRLKWDYKAQLRFDKDEFKKFLSAYLDNVFKVDKSYTTMERIIQDKDMQSRLGIIIHKDKMQVELLNDDSEQKIYYILYLLKKKVINVTHVYNKQLREEFYRYHFTQQNEWQTLKSPYNEENLIDGPGGGEPTPGLGGGEPTPGLGGGEPTPGPGGGEPTPGPGGGEPTPDPEGIKNQPPLNEEVLFSGITYEGGHKGIWRALYEIHNIKLKYSSKYLLSLNYLVRTLIECTLQEYLSKNSLLNNWNKPNQDPSITDLIKYCAQNNTFRSINRNFHRVITTADAYKDYDVLNAVAHGKYSFPNLGVLKTIESRWYVLVKHMIEDLNSKK